MGLESVAKKLYGKFRALVPIALTLTALTVSDALADLRLNIAAFYNGNRVENVQGNISGSALQPNYSFTTNSNGTISIDIIPTGVNQDKTAVPEGYYLRQNYPNPFNPGTMIEFGIPKPENVSINIYGIRGDLIRELLKEYLSAGQHSKEWDGNNQQGIEVSNDVYIYVIMAGQYSEAKKMIHLKGVTHGPIGSGYLGKNAGGEGAEADSLEVLIIAGKTDNVTGKKILDYNDSQTIPVRGTANVNLNMKKVEQEPVVANQPADTTASLNDTISWVNIFYDPNSDNMNYSANNSAVKFNGNTAYLVFSGDISNLVFTATDEDSQKTSTNPINVTTAKPTIKGNLKNMFAKDSAAYNTIVELLKIVNTDTTVAGRDTVYCFILNGTK